MKYVLIFLFFVCFSKLSNAQIQHKTSVFAKELCSDTSILNCWEYYFYEEGTVGFFELNFDGSINYSGGFYLLDGDLDRFINRDSLLLLINFSKDSLKFDNAKGNAFEIHFINDRMAFMDEYYNNEYTINKQYLMSCFQNRLSKDWVQEKLLAEIFKMHFGTHIFSKEFEKRKVTPYLNYSSNTLDIEYFTAPTTISRKFINPNRKRDELVVEREIPIHIILSVDIVR